MLDIPPKQEGLRERKRRETLARISETGLELFLAKGYEATTLDEIAAAAGISRRTFFHYFESKDELLLAYVGGYADALKALVLESASAGEPIDVVRDALVKLSSRFNERKMIATTRLMRENEVLRARNQAQHLKFEQAVTDGLSELWPRKDRRDRLRIVAMVAMGALRLAVDAWLEQDGKRPLVKHIEDVFRNLKAEI